MIRTAIRTYQSGGEIDTGQMLDERYFQPEQPPPEVTPPVTPTPQASPIQPPPGAAGPTPTATPPPGAAPALPPPAPPPQGDQPVPYGQPRPGLGPRAINVEGQQQTQVDEHDADLPKQTSSEQKAWQIRRSPTGDQPILPSEAPEKYKLEDDPRYADYKRAYEIYQTKNGNPKLQRQLQPQLNRLFNDIKTDTTNKNKAEHDAYVKQQRDQLQKLDADYLKALQVPNLNQLINDGLGAQASIFDKVIAEGKPADAQEATMKRRMSPLDTMTNSEQRYVIRNLMALNKKIDADQAAQILTLIGSPVMPGQKGANGLTGRAGTKYVPDSTDLLGNRQVRVPGFGLIRITPEFLDTVNKRRLEGYNAGIKYQADLVKQRAAAKAPNAFDRAAAPVLDWISKQVQ